MTRAVCLWAPLLGAVCLNAHDARALPGEESPLFVRDPRGLAISPGPRAWMYLVTGEGLLGRDLAGRGGGGWRILGRLGRPDEAGVVGDAADLDRSARSERSSSAGGPLAVLAAGEGRLVVGGSAGLDEWEVREAGVLRRHVRLDGRAVAAAVADADGRRIYATQGRTVWMGQDGRWQRVTAWPGRVFRLLAAHPRRPGWLLGSDGRGIFRSRDSGRSWKRILESLPGPIEEVRFAACPGITSQVAPVEKPDQAGPGRGAGRRGTRRALGASSGLIVVRSARTVFALDAGRASVLLVAPVPPRALLEAHADDPAVYLLADRIYRWPCHGREAPRVLAADVHDVIALARDRLKSRKLWLLGPRGLASHIVRSAGLRAAGARRGARARPRVPWSPDQCHDAPKPGPDPSDPPRRPGRWRLARYFMVPAVTLRFGGVLRERVSPRGREVFFAGRRLAHHYGIFFVLAWPLEAPASAILAEERARVRARSAEEDRRVRRLQRSCIEPSGDPLKAWAAEEERSALVRFQSREEVRPRLSSPGQGGTR